MNRAFPLLALLILTLVALPLVAQEKKDGKKDKKTNAPACPVSGKPAAEGISAPHKGGKVFFDSEESKQKFADNSQPFTPAANYQLFVTGQARQTKCPIVGKNLGPTAINVAGVGVCCVGCQGKVAKLSQPQRLEMMFGANFDKLYVVAGAR